MTERDESGAGRPVRVAILDAQPGQLEQGTRRILLKAGVEIVLALRAGDVRHFGERAQALRDARPDVVVVPFAANAGADELVLLAEPLRFGCGAQRPAPRVLLACGDDGAIARATALLAPFEVDLMPDVRTDTGRLRAVSRLREMRAVEGVVLRDEALEDLATGVAADRQAATLVVDVSGSSTSLVRAEPAGGLVAAHVRSLGTGSAADRVVARAGLDRVRRWIPWAVDQPTLLERVFNRARWPGAVPTDRESLAVEIALAHEAIAHAVSDAVAAGIGPQLRAATLVVLTGRLTALAPAQASLVAVDALDLPSPASIARYGDGALVPLAAAVPIAPARRGTVRVTWSGAPREERVERDGLHALPVEGEIEVSGAGVTAAHLVAGPVGAILDGRARPLAIPLRDAERVPLVTRWFASVGASPEIPSPASEAAST
ncbi:MAG: glutamate mutase L [Chloroflexota bacterium]|nr:glutamate mutase L [Chloroflexota bacterium]MDE3192357.1 glutamate mutase L [Chloroflexota bacterium]